jgi:ribulose-5-phosphate 4-epimerase/fuculose-1-phosphate aldolase
MMSNPLGNIYYFPIMTISPANHDPDLLVQQYREDLAASFHWFARLHWHEAHANHFSVAVSDCGSEFLINPCGRHFSNVRASELLLLNTNKPMDLDGGNAPDPTAWYIHSALHRNNPKARCVMHLHSPGALALSCLEDKLLPPIDNNTARFFDRVAVDNCFDGMSLSEGEADRLADCIGEKPVLLMGNHGVLVVGESIAQAFDDLYYFERACQTYIAVLSTGREASIMSDEIAEKTAQQWKAYSGFAESHLCEVREILDREEPDYKN